MNIFYQVRLSFLEKAQCLTSALPVCLMRFAEVLKNWTAVTGGEGDWMLVSTGNDGCLNWWNVEDDVKSKFK
jgi:hypothetical protein